MLHFSFVRRFFAAGVLTVLLAVITFPITGFATAATAVDCESFSCTDVAFTGGGGLTLHGTVIGPAGTPSETPGVVLVGGSGPVPRTQLQFEARAFAAAGITALIYDKRTDGYSFTHRDFALLADDALAAARALRHTAGVRADKVGLWGFSEGGWVAPLAASHSADIAFLITLGASGFSPLRTQTWSLAMNLRHRGARGSLPETIAGPTARLLGDTGAFPAADFDPLPALTALRIPVLALWGQYDMQVPPAESAAVLRNTLTASPSVTIDFLPDAAHNGRSTSNGFDRLGVAPGAAAPPGAFAPGYLDTMTTWIHRTADGTPPPSSAAAPPSQTVTSTDPGHGWSTSARTQIALCIATILAFTAYPLRTSTKGGTTRATRLSRLLSCTAVVSILATLTYTLSILVFNAQPTGPTIASRSLIWLILQSLAVLTTVFLAATAITAARPGLPTRHRIAQSVPLLAGCLWLAWAIMWGLFSV
ncbi:alpha/beta hydrolase family protein [Nocardia sp. NPDC058058]|uniref:alpha/beta hydrolase family protein n=1 Tax=Nocardia sp. NPDC058058 TaxID=3346317 RepID=UPI0036DAFEA3